MNNFKDKPPRIWVSQSLPRAQDSANDFHEMGLSSVILPVLNIKHIGKDNTPPRLGAALIFTSRNGVLAFSKCHSSRIYKVLCVGDATAALAIDKGFADVLSAKGTAEDVAKLAKEVIPKSTPIYHCTSPQSGMKIVDDLSGAGYEVSKLSYYQSVPVTHLPVTHLKDEIAAINYVAIYSPMAARALSRLIAETDVSDWTFLSISDATDLALKHSNIGSRLVAERPNQRAMCEALRLDLQMKKRLS